MMARTNAEKKSQVFTQPRQKVIKIDLKFYSIVFRRKYIISGFQVPEKELIQVINLAELKLIINF